MMTRDLVSSFRDEDNKKYKLYRDEEQEQWTVVSDAQLFGGTREAAEAFLKGLGLEVPESIPVHQEYEDPKDAELTPEEDEFVEEIVKKAEEKLGEKIVLKEAESVTEVISEAQERIDNLPVKLVDESGEETTVAEVFEKVVEATKEKIAETNQTMSKAEQIDAEIAALKAKKAELKK